MKFTPEENAKMAEQMNGNIYVHLWITNFLGSNYSLTKDYYMVENGVVYHVHPTGIYPSGDTLFDIYSDCTLIGKFDPNVKYESGSKDVSFKRLLKFFS